MAIEVQLLGRFSARRSGEEIPSTAFGGRLARVLTRVLVTRRGSFVPNDVLAEALWPERMPADPNANLRVLVQRARSAFGDPAVIETGPGGYSFAAGGRFVVDTEVFLSAVRAGQEQLAAGRAGAALREFRAALELWAGEPLPEDAYEDWAQEPRNAVHRALLHALEGGAEAALALRDPDQAAALAERAVTREPLREPPALLLARALAVGGDQAAALHAIDSLRHRLAEEGLDPSPEVDDLQLKILRGELEAPKPRRHALVSPRPEFEGLPFVGREDELDALMAVLSGPGAGVATVIGPAGAGKSRLLAEAAARSDVPVIPVRAFLPERNEPWSLARSLLREALALDIDAARAVPERAAHALADILPEIAEVRSIGSDVVDPESRRALALEAAARLLAAAASGGALVIVDDLQWADATSLTVLGVIVSRIPEARMALAYRPEELAPASPLRTFLEHMHSVREPIAELHVGPLSHETISLIVADSRLAKVIAEETDRTPFAVTETIRLLSAEGIVERDGRGRWMPGAAETRRRAREIARAGQRQTIAKRAARQPHDRKQLLSLLALLGREAPARVLGRASGAAETKILDQLDALARAGLARLGESGWATAHDLIAEVVADTLERAERGRLHLLLARAIEAEGGDPAEVARHLAGAGDRAAAATAFAEGARLRLAKFAGDEARALADAGLGLDPEPEIRTALLRTRAEARSFRGDLAGARDDLRTALESIPHGPDRSRTLVRIAESTAPLDGFQQALDLIEVALAEAAGGRVARAEALTAAAFFHANRNEIAEAETLAAEALAAFEEIGNPAGVASILDLRSLVRVFQGRLFEAADLYDRAARLYGDCGLLLRVGGVRLMRAWMLLLNDKAEEALRDADEALDLERALGQTEGEAWSLWVRGEVLVALGRREEARRDILAALEAGRELGLPELESAALRALAVLHEAAGDLEGAERALREAIEVAAPSEMSLDEHVASGMLASVLVRRGNLDEAEEYAADLLKAGGLFEFDGRLVLAEVALERGDPNGEQMAAEALSLTDAGGYLLSRTRKRLEARLGREKPQSEECAS
jgi:DNA-binding SARP family transcriptional activator